MQEWLHLLKDALEKLPPATVTEQSLDLKGVKLANHVPGKPVTLEFRPPEVHIVHSENPSLLIYSVPFYVVVVIDGDYGHFPNT